MVGAIDRKLLRDLTRLRGQVITIALVVAAGVGVFVALRATWGSLIDSRDDYYAQYRFADVFARCKRAPGDVALRIEAIDGVSVVQTRVVEHITLPVEGMAEPAVGTIISIPAPDPSPLNDLYLRAGRLPEPGHDDEVVVMETFTNAHGLRPGDALPAIVNGSRRELRIVGTALSPEYIFAASPSDFTPDDRRVAILWMDRDVLAPAFEMNGAFNDVSLRLQPGASLPAVQRELDDILEPYGGLGAIGRDKQQSNFMLDGELAGLEQLATAFPLIFLLVAAFLLNVVLSRLVSLQRQQIAVLKALGYTSRRIALHYLELVLIISLLGAALGVGLGLWLGGALTELYGGYFRFPVLAFEAAPGILAVAVLTALAAATLGALVAVRNVVRMPPAEAMRPPAPTRYKASLLDRLGLARLFGQSGMMVIREIRRRPWRMLLSALGIAAAVGVLVVSRFGVDSFDYLIFTVLHEEQRGDLTVAFREPIPERAARELLHLPGVLDAEGNRIVPVRFRAGHQHRDAAILGIADRPRLRRVIERDARPVDLPDDGIAVSAKLAEVLGVGVGDTIGVELLEGNRAHRELDVSLLVDDGFGLQGYMSASRVHAFLGEEPVLSVIHLRIDRTLENEIQERLKRMPTVASITRTRTMIERFDEQTGETMLIMTAVMTLFAVVIAAGVVYNNARVALSMRSRDLASLRVIGFTRGEISAVLLGELAIQLVLALPLGLALGTLWTRSLMSAVDPEVYRIPVIISTQSYAFAVVVTAIAGVVSALLVRRKLDHLDLIGVLKTRE